MAMVSNDRIDCQDLDKNVLIAAIERQKLEIDQYREREARLRKRIKALVEQIEWMRSGCNPPSVRQPKTLEQRLVDLKSDICKACDRSDNGIVVRDVIKLFGSRAVDTVFNAEFVKKVLTEIVSEKPDKYTISPTSRGSMRMTCHNPNLLDN